MISLPFMIPPSFGVDLIPTYIKSTPNDEEPAFVDIRAVTITKNHDLFNNIKSICDAEDDQISKAFSSIPFMSLGILCG